MLPTFNKRCLSAVFAAFLGLFAAAPAQAAKAPKIKAAYAVDGDRDGHVDGVSLKWSTRVRGGYDAQAPFAVAVRGYRVTRVDAAIGKKQRIHVAERRECDTGGAVRLKFRGKGRGTARVKARRGKRPARSHKLDMRRFDVPVPRITCAVTLDRDANGRVDGVRVTYSRKVKSRKQTRGRFLFSVAGYKITAVKAARGRFLKINLAERGPVDSDAKPAIGYSRPSRKSQRKFAIRSGKRGDAFAGTYRSTRDGVSPQLVAAATGDDDRDGLLDAMTVRFSEPVLVEGGSAFSVLGMRVTTARANGAAVALQLAENTARGDALPGTSIAGPGVMDLSGNTALQGAVAPADAAPPVLIGAVTQDVGGVAGRIDALTVGFSEPVAHPRDAGGAYPFLLADRQVTSVEPASGRTVQVRIAEADAGDTGDRPSVRYMPGAGLPVADVAGNQAAEGFVGSADGVAPVLMSATTADDDSDGRIDGSLLRFSESVQHGAEGGGSSFALAGYGVTAAGAASGTDIALTLSESGGPDSDATPAVTYTRDGVEDVRDAAGNSTPNSSLGQAADGARPVLLSVQTTDVDDDGRIDRLASTWSEPLNHADDSQAPFAVSASGFSVARVRAASGDDLAIDLVEPSGYDTGSTPALTYLGSASAIRDAAGLEPEQRTWAGLTVDALRPRIVSATTGDTNADGQLDSIAVKYSEAVVHGAELAQVSFTADLYAVSSVKAASGDTVELELQPSGAGDTGTLPELAYTPDGQEDVRDTSGNFAPATPFAQTVDGARPVLLSAATVNVDGDDRLDRVSTEWSEPLDDPNDSSAPFPLSAEQPYVVSGVHAPDPQTPETLDVDLTEHTAPDTGSAPDLTYTGGTDPIRDTSGLEPAQRSYSDLTRDALPPQRISTYTVDKDHDGRLDGVEIEWSEKIVGSADSGPFVIDHANFNWALNPAVTLNDSRTTIAFDEDPDEHDTHRTPDLTYTAGDLEDEAEGAGDTPASAPSFGPVTTVDKAPPIAVTALTRDFSTPGGGTAENGTIDAIRVEFSEEIEHQEDGPPYFALDVANRQESVVEEKLGAGNKTLLVHLDENQSPDGGVTPQVSVISSGLSNRIRDRASEPNAAHPMAITPTDGVRPVLVGAQLGERPGGAACTEDAAVGITGRIDCAVTTWSEPVSHPGSGPSDSALAADAMNVTDITASLGTSALEVGLADVPDVPDRDRDDVTISYSNAAGPPVEDGSGNDALDHAGVKATAACPDKSHEPDDDHGVNGDDPGSGSPLFGRKCAFDDDWVPVQVNSSRHLDLFARPGLGVNLSLELYTAADPANPVLPTTSTSGNAGEADRLTFTDIDEGVYWAKVTATDTPQPQEGQYCLVYSDDPLTAASCSQLAGLIVFTEIGLGADKFIEIKNDGEEPVEMNGADAVLKFGADEDRECTLAMPTNAAASILAPGDHAIIENTPTATSFGCDQISSLGPVAEQLAMYANGTIDLVPFDGSVINSPLANEHSLEFVERDDEDHRANDDVATRWCRTFVAHTKGAAGDGCDEYRINEVLFRPVAPVDGKSFVELAGNIPAYPNSSLLGGWLLNGVNGQTGGVTPPPPTLRLPPDASPRSNGTYVVADGFDDGPGTDVPNSPDLLEDFLNLASPDWPDGTGVVGPRGIQLLTPEASFPCTGLVDAFGWTTTAMGLTAPDLRYGCSGFEGAPYTEATVGPSAARGNLSDGADTSYNENPDTGNNTNDFCLQSPTTPGDPNIRPDCVG